jgi:hypothetical protein
MWDLAPALVERVSRCPSARSARSAIKGSAQRQANHPIGWVWNSIAHCRSRELRSQRPLGAGHRARCRQDDHRSSGNLAEYSTCYGGAIRWFRCSCTCTLLLVEQVRICSNVLRPKLNHYPLQLNWIVPFANRNNVSNRAEANASRVRIVGVRCEMRVGGLMDDALRRNIELVAPNQNARHGASPLG